jgi:LPXTG-motif cell wall-anchored protein
MAEPRSDSLACPRCALRYPLDERFCAKCGTPLTYAGQLNAEEPVTDRHATARKVNPVFSRGELRRVAIGRQQPEAEFIQMLLLDEGVPSTLRRTAGFDVPDMLAAGPRDVLVPESGLETARQVLLQADIEPTGAAPATPQTGERRSAAVLLLGILLGAGVLGLLTTIVVIVQNN